MSNQQWNNGQSPSEWDASQQPQQQPAQDWNWQSQPQPQPSGQEWNQPGQGGAHGWSQPVPPTSAPEWNQSGHDWTQGQQASQAPQWQAQPGWDQQNQQQWQGQGQQQWGQQPGQGYMPVGQGAPAAPPAPKKPSPFDFSFTKPALPDAAGTIFLVGSIGIGVWWLFQLISGFDYFLDFPLQFFAAFLGDAGLAIFGIMLLRALVEVGVALTKKKPEVEPKDDDDSTVIAQP